MELLEINKRLAKLAEPLGPEANASIVISSKNGFFISVEDTWRREGQAFRENFPSIEEALIAAELWVVQYPMLNRVMCAADLGIAA